MVNFVRKNTDAIISLRTLYSCTFIVIMVAAFVGGLMVITICYMDQYLTDESKFM